MGPLVTRTFGASDSPCLCSGRGPACRGALHHHGAPLLQAFLQHRLRRCTQCPAICVLPLCAAHAQEQGGRGGLQLGKGRVGQQLSSGTGHSELDGGGVSGRWSSGVGLRWIEAGHRVGTLSELSVPPSNHLVHVPLPSLTVGVSGPSVLALDQWGDGHHAHPRRPRHGHPADIGPASL